MQVYHAISFDLSTAHFCDPLCRNVSRPSCSCRFCLDESLVHNGNQYLSCSRYPSLSIMMSSKPKRGNTLGIRYPMRYAIHRDRSNGSAGMGLSELAEVYQKFVHSVLLTALCVVHSSTERPCYDYISSSLFLVFRFYAAQYKI